MRAPRVLRRRARERAEIDLFSTVTAVVRTEMEQQQQAVGFAPTSGYATTERAQEPHDWHRPTIGFSPNGI